jgi:hypothetical protein
MNKIPTTFNDNSLCVGMTFFEETKKKERGGVWKNYVHEKGEKKLR